MWINRKARHEFNIHETKEVGVILRGGEVKSIRKNGVSLGAAFAALSEGSFWIYKLSVAPYEFALPGGWSQERPKKLLLKVREIRRWIGAVKRLGYTLIPLKAYFSQRGFFKLEIGLCSGKSKRDKRASEKERESIRELRQEL